MKNWILALIWELFWFMVSAIGMTLIAKSLGQTTSFLEIVVFHTFGQVFSARMCEMRNYLKENK